MNPYNLLTALRSYLKEELQSLPLDSRSRTENKTLTAECNVFIGQLPAKTQNNAYDAPFVLIQALNGHEAEGWHNVQVALRLLIYAENNENAEIDLHNLISLIRRALIKCRQNALEGYFVLQESARNEILPWTRPDDQTPPYIEAYIISDWLMPGMEN